MVTLDRGSYHFSRSIPIFNLLDQFITSRGLYYGEAGLKMKRRFRLDPPPQQGDPHIQAELETAWADVFDSDLMITSASTRRPKAFTFKMRNGTAKNNNGYSDHLPIVTTIETV